MRKQNYICYVSDLTSSMTCFMFSASYQGNITAVDNISKLFISLSQNNFHLRILSSHARTDLFLWRMAPGAFVAGDIVAALPGEPDQTGAGAGRRGRRQLVRAERRAAHGPVDAGALMFTAGTETLAVLINPAVVLARASL